MDEIVLTVEGRDFIGRTLDLLSNRALERLLEMVFVELRARGVWYGLDGPYPSWDRKWGEDATWILERRGKDKRYTIQPTPNPRSCSYEPPFGGAAGSEPNQSNRV